MFGTQHAQKTWGLQGEKHETAYCRMPASAEAVTGPATKAESPPNAAPR